MFGFINKGGVNPERQLVQTITESFTKPMQATLDSVNADLDRQDAEAKARAKHEAGRYQAEFEGDGARIARLTNLLQQMNGLVDQQRDIIGDASNEIDDLKARIRELEAKEARLRKSIRENNFVIGALKKRMIADGKTENEVNAILDAAFDEFATQE